MLTFINNKKRALFKLYVYLFLSVLDEILEKIKESGFQVALQKEIQLSREQAEEFYKEHTGEAYFEELINRMTK